MRSVNGFVLRKTGVAMAAALLAALVGITAASAQSIRPEVPFLDDWLRSPHAKVDAEAFNHWNKEGVIDEACARCHSTPGFRDYIGADGSTPWKVDKKAPVGTVVECVACHNPVTRFLTFVTFPSGLKVENVGPQARCMTCHQGRESTVSVDAAIKGKDPDTVDAGIKFLNVHYRAAGATRFGTEAKGAYEYSGKTYRGLFVHDPVFTQCMDCHNPHTTEVAVEQCAFCHRGVRSKDDLIEIRKSKGDFDGDGNDREGIGKEIGSLHEALFAAIRAYAKDVIGKPIAYNPHNYPYFFNDSNDNGQSDENEAKFPNRYQSWTPRLLQAAYNYQFVAKDPGAFAHNPMYVIQILHDSLADLGAKVAVAMDKMTRPPQ